jgi:hypothetical protein
MTYETFDQFLRSKGVTTKNILAFRRVVAWQLSEAMMTAGISENELIRRIRTRPDLIGPFLDSPESAPLLITTLREALAAAGKPVITFWDTVQQRSLVPNALITSRAALACAAHNDSSCQKSPTARKAWRKGILVRRGRICGCSAIGRIGFED